MSRVLLIYTGGTIGMRNTREHGYVPVAGYLQRVLSGMTRFHDPEGILAAADEDVALTTVPEHMLVNRVVRQPGDKAEKVPALVTPPSLWGKRILYSILEYTPLLDSSNMTMSDWVKIASDVEANYEFYGRAIREASFGCGHWS
jgi:lysophospholipase